MSETDFVCAARIDPRQAFELCQRGAAEPTSRELPAPALYLRHRLRPAARGFELLKGAARPLVKALYVFPLLVLVKLGLRLAGIDSAWITVAFVALVVALFALLALLMLLFPLVGPRSQREPRAEIALPDPDAGLEPALELLGQPRLEPLGAEQLAALAQPGGTPPEGGIRLRGRLAGGPSVAEGDALLGDRWLLRDDDAVRAFAGRHFALVGEGQPPVVVELDGAPWIVGRYWRRPHPLALGPLQAFEAHLGLSLAELSRRGVGVTLHAGEEVELVVTDVRTLRDASELMIDGEPSELGGAAGKGPYRREGASPCLHARCTPGAPVVIRPL